MLLSHLVFMVKRKLVTNQDVMTQCFYDYKMLMWVPYTCYLPWNETSQI